MVNFYLGSDPELMLRDAKTKVLRSAIPYIQEGKGQGRPLDSKGENSVLHDNVLVEFNTKPAQNQKEFVQVVGFSLKEISKIVAKEGLELHLLTSANFPEEELQAEEARIFGCEPDFDAYELTMNLTDSMAAFNSFRSSGGHIHVGFRGENKLTDLLKDPFGKIKVVKALDVFVGIPSIFIDKDPSAKTRRQLYGKAGSHRPKEYGVEWRACGPWWLASPKHCAAVYQLTKVALNIVCLDGELEKVIEELGGEVEVQRVINNSDIERAKDLYTNQLLPYYSEKIHNLIDLLCLETEVPNLYTTWKL